MARTDEFGTRGYSLPEAEQDSMYAIVDVLRAPHESNGMNEMDH